MDSRDFGTFPPFRARGKTLFCFDRSRQEWTVTTWDGTEARIPAGDLLEFVEKLQEFLESGASAR